jgi:hypothetical protein
MGVTERPLSFLNSLHGNFYMVAQLAFEFGLARAAAITTEARRAPI